MKTPTSKPNLAIKKKNHTANHNQVQRILTLGLQTKFDTH